MMHRVHSTVRAFRGWARANGGRSAVIARAGVLLAAVMMSAPGISAQAQLYRSSVVGTDYDFITDADPSVFASLEDLGPQQREMADKRPGTDDLIKPAFVFRASFTDGTGVDIVIDAAFGSVEAARAEAMRYVHPLGKLPTLMRHGLTQALVVHQGGEEFTAFSDRGLIIMYSGNATRRIGTHDLEETMFHEAVHASLDHAHARSEGWVAAQASDGTFVTRYGARLPDREDLAESALFAYTLLHHPERLPEESAKQIRAAIPARIAYIATILPPDQPIVWDINDPANAARAALAAHDEPAPGNMEPPSGPPTPDGCLGNIALRGILADVLANALRDDFSVDVPAPQLVGMSGGTNGKALFRAVVAKYGLDPTALRASILRHQHVNCTHAQADNAAWAGEVERW